MLQTQPHTVHALCLPQVLHGHGEAIMGLEAQEASLHEP